MPEKQWSWERMKNACNPIKKHLNKILIPIVLLIISFLINTTIGCLVLGAIVVWNIISVFNLFGLSMDGKLLMSRHNAGLLACTVLIVGYVLYSRGYFPISNPQNQVPWLKVEPVQWFSFFTVLLSLFLMWLNFGLIIKERETAGYVSNLVTESQAFYNTVTEQVSALCDHFHLQDLTPKDTQKTVIFDIYISSLAFGILGGSKGLIPFRMMINNFCAEAKKRNNEDKATTIKLYLWTKENHKEALAYRDDSTIWLWEEYKKDDIVELNKIKTELSSIAQSFKSLSGCSHVNLECYDIKKVDTLRVTTHSL